MQRPWRRGNTDASHISIRHGFDGWVDGRDDFGLRLAFDGGRQ
jgi:hypothetical protein